MAGVDKPDSIRIGLFGRTGTGKTSLINSLHYMTMRRRTRSRLDRMTGVDQPDLIHIKPFGCTGIGKSSLFNPLQFSTKNQNLGATTRVQAHEEQTDTQNTEEEGKDEEEEDHIAMESLPYETGRKTRYRLDRMIGVDQPDSIHNKPSGRTGIRKSSYNPLQFSTKNMEKNVRKKLPQERLIHCELDLPDSIPIEPLYGIGLGNSSLLKSPHFPTNVVEPQEMMIPDGFDKMTDDLIHIRPLGLLGIGNSSLLNSRDICTNRCRTCCRCDEMTCVDIPDSIHNERFVRPAIGNYYLPKSLPKSPHFPTKRRRTRCRPQKRLIHCGYDEMAGVDIPDSIHNEPFGGTGKGKSSLLNSPHFPTKNEVNVKPIKMECFKRVGAEGGKLQLDSFGIELEIPPGAIDSEAPQDFSLSVLTDTSNLGNSKEEMSVCFGVQCLAPDDLVLKLPVTYTIPHCAVITGTRYSSVEAVLYTGEGEYSPDAVVKERIMLSRSGIPSCTITKDVLKLKMNHFSWMVIKFLFRDFLFRDFFFREKRMCCQVFTEKNLALQRTPVILHAHLYDDIKGNSEIVKRQEEEQEFVPAYPEQPVLIQAGKGDLKMTCHVNTTVIGGPVVIPYDQLMSGARICEPFQLDFTNQPDIVAVSLIVGQVERLQVHLLFRLDFSTLRRTEGASSQDSDEPVGATPRAQVLKEWTDTQNTMEEDKEEEEEEYYIAMESLPNETDELVEATARVQVHEQQTDTQNTTRRKGGRKRKRGRRGLRSYGNPAP